MHFEKAIYRVLHEGSNNAASFAGRPEVHEKLTFPHALWINNDKSNKTTRTRTTYILKMLYTGCSMKEAISLFPYHLFHFPRSHGVIMIDQSSKDVLSFPSDRCGNVLY